MTLTLITLSISLLILIVAIATITYKSRKSKIQPSQLSRFRKKFKSNSRLREKLKAQFSESLMADPERNIQIGTWDQENELREKADIHRARLNKYGHSIMNGEKFFMEAEGKVYKYTPKGKRKYI